jgi:hypothetical protein
VFHVLSTLALILTIAVGQLGWPAYPAFIGIIAFGARSPCRCTTRGFEIMKMSDMIRILVVSPFDLLLDAGPGHRERNHDHRVIVSPPR